MTTLVQQDGQVPTLNIACLVSKEKIGGLALLISSRELFCFFKPQLPFEILLNKRKSVLILRSVVLLKYFLSHFSYLVHPSKLLLILVKHNSPLKLT